MSQRLKRLAMLHAMAGSTPMGGTFVALRTPSDACMGTSFLWRPRVRTQAGPVRRTNMHKGSRSESCTLCRFRITSGRFT